MQHVSLRQPVEKCYCLSVAKVSYGRETILPTRGDLLKTSDRATTSRDTPTHRLVVHDLKGAWTKSNRDVAFALFDTFMKTKVSICGSSAGIKLNWLYIKKLINYNTYYLIFSSPFQEYVWEDLLLPLSAWLWTAKLPPCINLVNWIVIFQYEILCHLKYQNVIPIYFNNFAPIVNSIYWFYVVE